MTKVFMTKSSSDVGWGFEIASSNQSSAEKSTILITKVNDNSPSFDKLSVADQILEIAGNSTTNLSITEANDLIKKCGNALFMNIVKHSAKNEYSSSTIRELAKAHENVSERLPILFDLKNPMISRTMHTLKSEGAMNIPVPPPLNERSIKQYKKTTLENEKINSKVEKIKVASEFEQRIPERLLSSMNKPGMKPFTYTPRGVDLDEIMEKARKRRQLHKHIQEPIQPEERKIEQDINQYKRNQSNMKTVQQMSTTFSGQTRNLQSHQSKSFHRLEGWVEENANTTPVKQPVVTTKSAVALAVEEETSSPMGLNQTIPSNAFRYLQQSCNKELPILTNQGRNSESMSAGPHITDQQIYRRVPARDRDREPEAHKYQGADIPSKSFRLLQEYTTTQNMQPQCSVQHNKFKNTIPAEDIYDYRQTSIPSRSFKYLQKMSDESELEQGSSMLRSSIQRPSDMNTYTSF